MFLLPFDCNYKFSCLGKCSVLGLYTFSLISVMIYAISMITHTHTHTHIYIYIYIYIGFHRLVDFNVDLKSN